MDLLAARRRIIHQNPEQLQLAPARPGTMQWRVDHQRRHLAEELNWLDEIEQRIQDIEQ